MLILSQLSASRVQCNCLTYLIVTICYLNSTAHKRSLSTFQSLIKAHFDASILIFTFQQDDVVDTIKFISTNSSRL